jgi:hypothetical protein
MSSEIEQFLTGDTDAQDERTDATLAGLGVFGVGHVSASQIGQYQRCPRQWAYRQVLKLKVPPDGGLLVGSGVHYAAEVGMQHKMDTGTNPEPDQAAEAAAQYVTEQIATGEVTMNDDDHAGALTDKAVRLSQAWATEAAPLVEPRAVEERFDVVLSGIPVTGRLDVVTDTTVVDWKTSGKSPSRDDLVKSIQTSLYARATRKPVSYVYLVNQVKAVKVVPVDVTADECTQASRLADSTVAEVAAGMALGVWPRNRTGWHCSAKWCGYHDRCMSGRDDATIDERAADARAAAGVMW